MEPRDDRSAESGAVARPDRGRDRDAEGKARNARPRDGLGRPLPYGAPGVPRAPEGVVRTAGASVDEAQELLRAGRPFHAHEVFEDAWKSGPAEQRALWRGLAQTAVGLTHAARGTPPAGPGCCGAVPTRWSGGRPRPRRRRRAGWTPAGWWRGRGRWRTGWTPRGR